MILLLATTAAFAQYTGSTWTYVWDFTDGLQGWTLGTNGGATGYWTDPGWVPSAGPTLPDGQPSGGGTRNLFLPDKSYARLDVTALNLGTGAGRKGFIFQADIYVPNLYPLTGFPYGYPGNAIHQAGIGAIRANDPNMKMIVAEMDEDTNGKYIARDYTWDNTTRSSASWIIEEDPSVPYSAWWDKWITIQIDYAYTNPAYWSAYVYMPWDNPIGPAGWWPIAVNREVNPGVQWGTLQMGGTYSWTQGQWDNAKLLVVPEPGSILALGAGLMGLVGAMRRRR